jgi:phospholipid-transporting ATPase
MSKYFINSSKFIEKKLTKHLEHFGKRGLRTLVFAEREISEEEYKIFSQLYYLASTALTEKKEKVSNCYESIEKNMTLIGATSIEDSLQDELSMK